MLTRSFEGDGWLWLRPLPPCLPTTVSLRLLTSHPNAILLYSGPLTASVEQPIIPPGHPIPPILVLQLVEGRPQLILQRPEGLLRVQVEATVNDGEWHTIHVRLDDQIVGVMVDYCGRGWQVDDPDHSHCLAWAAWTRPTGAKEWAGGWPLQVGGLAHTPSSPGSHAWSATPTPRPLNGCVSHLTINGQLEDLGSPPNAHNTASGCRPQQEACPWGCGPRGHCAGGLHRPQCQCMAGWSDQNCATPTVPVTLRSSSYLKTALSFTPGSWEVSAQVRIRMTAARHGLILRLAQRHHRSALNLQLRAGVACVSVSGVGWVAREACVLGRPLHDGAWHVVRTERHGHNLVISVDDGDLWLRNETLATLDVMSAPGGGENGRGVRTPPPGTSPRGPLPPPPPLEVDRHDGVTVGGVPEFVGVSLVAVHHDLHDVCLDDLRVSGRPLPLPPSSNGTAWGQVTTLEGLEKGCHVLDPCEGANCSPPLSCTTTWGQPVCRCGPGSELVGRTCADVDECMCGPCLHGGTCLNQQPGYSCLCGPGYQGSSCQWPTLATPVHPLAAPLTVAALAASLLLVVVVGVLLSLRLHRWRANRGPRPQEEQEAGTFMEVERNTDAEGGRKRRSSGEEASLEGDGPHKAFLQLMSLPSPRPQLKMGTKDIPPDAGTALDPCGSQVIHSQNQASSSTSRRLDIIGVVDLLKHLPETLKSFNVQLEELEATRPEAEATGMEAKATRTDAEATRTEAVGTRTEAETTKTEPTRTDAEATETEAETTRPEAEITRPEAKAEATRTEAKTLNNQQPLLQKIFSVTN
nr:neural-cadherin-like isoform X2 [Procambarus clarkii]